MRRRRRRGEEEERRGGGGEEEEEWHLAPGMRWRSALAERLSLPDWGSMCGQSEEFVRSAAPLSGEGEVYVEATGDGIKVEGAGQT